MVNKGRIHGEIRDFREIFFNLIKSDHELVIEVRANGRFRKRTQIQIHGIKNHSIWITNRREIKERSREKFLKNLKNESPKLKMKLN